MSETVTPKPGDPTLYAQTAKTHAKLAAATLAYLNELTDAEEIAATAAMASAHALASLAYTQLNPPPRRWRPRPAGSTSTRPPGGCER